MRRFSSRKPSPAMVVALIALVAALSGSAIALPGKNTVDSGDIKNNVIRSKDVRNGQIATKDVKNDNLRSNDIRNNTLTGNDLNEGSLGQVPSANTANSASTANTANTANSANTATSAGSVEGPDTKNLVSGYATINGVPAAPTVLNFGGKRVTSVSVVRVALGIYDVTFNGSFPGVDSLEDVMFVANIWDTDNAGEVAATSAGDSGSASPTQITTRFATYNGATFIDREFAVILMTP